MASPYERVCQWTEVGRIAIERWAGNVIVRLACPKHGMAAAFIRYPELKNQNLAAHWLVRGKLEDVRSQELAWLYRHRDLAHELAVWSLQQCGHDRRLAPTRVGGGPNANFRNDFQALVQDLLDRLLGPDWTYGIDNVIGVVRNEACVRRQAQQ